MSSSINTTKASLGNEFLKRTREHISGAVGEYIKEVMPTTTSTLSDAKSTIKEISSTFKNTTQSIFPKIRELKTQVSFRNIARWYMNAEDEYGFESGSSDSDLSFDIPEEMQSEIATVEISESSRNASKVSSAVIESSHQMVEAQISTTANIMSSLDKQTGVISAGFDKVNNTLEKMLEVITKNTSSIIEATVANASERSAANEMVSRGRFDFNQYKKIVEANFMNSELGMVMPFISMFTDPNMLQTILSTTPKELMKAGIGFGINKLAPNFKQGMKHLDDAINDTIMTSLIRIFEDGRNNRNSLSGQLGKLFGIDASQERVSTERSTLELKSVPFDTITKEAITNTIPGYLRKILVALGGADEVYDYRSRSFRSQNAIKQDFIKYGADLNNLQYASTTIRNSVNTNSKYNNALYDLMMADLGQRVSDGTAQDTAKKFVSDKRGAVKYVKELVKGTTLESDAYNDQMYAFIKSMSDATKGMGHVDLMNQVYKNNVDRNQRMSDYIKNADAYNIDLSEVRDSYENDRESITKKYGISYSDKAQRVEDSRSDFDKARIANMRNLSGVDYTNMALFEIYRRLNKGINVFQVGSSNERSVAYKERGEDYLPRPKGHRPKNAADVSSGAPTSILSAVPTTQEDPNLLKVDTEERTVIDENGNVITEQAQLTKGERFGRWAEQRGGALSRAVLTGDKNEIKNAFSMIVRDVSDVTGDAIKSGVSKVNETFGNISGYLGHKMFGTEYSYTEIGEDGQKHKVSIAKNEKGGIFGFIKDGFVNSFNNVKTTASKWFNSVSKYFDYGNNDENQDGANASKRKKFIAASVGALAGGGLLGGPIGLLMGAIAGNAVGGLDIGGKIKDFLFGRDDKGKAKGLLTKLGDKILDPIQYQFEKTAHYVGGALKKHIIGPLSDIGYAIKERITNTAESTFGKAFKAITNVITAPFKLLGKGLLNLVKAPVTFIGDITRTTMGVTGSGVEGGLGILANIIGGKGAKEGLKQRRKDRAEEFKQDKKDSGFYFGVNPFKRSNDYKEWQERNQTKRANIFNKFKEYTSEQQAAAAEETAHNTEQIVSSLEETTNAVSGIAESTSQTRDDVGTIAYHSTHTDGEHSIFTHDHGIHHRLDKLIEILSDKYNERSSIAGEIDESEVPTSTTKAKQSQYQLALTDNNESYANAALGAAASIIASDEVTSTDEKKGFSDISKETLKVNGDPNKISASLSDIVNSQSSKKEEAAKEKNTIWDTIKETVTNISSGIGGILGSIFSGQGLTTLLGALAAVTGLYNLFTTDGAIGKVFDNLKHFLSNFTNDDKSKDPVTNGVNAALSLADMHVNNASDLVIPGASIYHNNTDAAGDQIVNQSATNAKEDILWRQNLRNEFTTPIYQNYVYQRNLGNMTSFQNKANLYQARANNSSGIQRLWNEARGKWYNNRAENALNNAIEADENRTSARGSTLSGIGRNVARLGVVSGISNITGNIAGGIGRAAGLDDQSAELLDTSVTTATAGALTINTMQAGLTPGKKSLVDKVIDTLKKALEWLAKKLKADKMLSKFATKIDDLCKKIINACPPVKFTKSIVTKIEAKITAALGEEALTAITLGATIAVGGIAGLVSGLCGVEHLFGILPGDADSIMKSISGILGAAFGALEMVPVVGWIIVIFDVLDTIVAGVLGKGIKQFLAEGLYNLLTGDNSKLAEKQNAMSGELAHYNETYGSNLDTSTFNDMINNQGMLDRIWRGKQQYDENGHLKFDEAGSRIDGGMKSFFVGGEKSYLHDENGNVLRDANGNAVKAVDTHGNLIKKDDKWGDAVGRGFSAVGRFFAGGEKYATDANGQAIWDNETQSYVVESTEKNIFGKTADFYNYTVDTTKNSIAKFVDNWNTGMDDIKAGLSKVGSGIKSQFDKFSDFGAKMHQEDQYARNLLNDPDSNWQDFFKFEEDPDNPMSPFYKVMAIGFRINVLPSAIFKAVGRSISKKAKEFAGYWKSGFDDLIDPIKTKIGGLMDDAKKIMDGFMIAWNYGMDDIKEDISNFTDNWNTGMDDIKAGLSNFGDKWKIGMNDIKENISSAVSGFTDNWNTGMDDIKAGLSNFGDKWKIGFDSIMTPIKANIEILRTSSEDLGAKAHQGDLAGIWTSTLNLQDGDPVSAIWHVSFGISRIFNSIIALISKLGGPIKEGLAKAGEFLSGYKDYLGEDISEKWESTKTATGNFFGGIGESISGALGNAWNWIKGVGGESMDARGGGEVTTGPKEKVASESETLVGGNPLDKPAYINSGYAPNGRTDIPGNNSPHYGIDLIPNYDKIGDQNARYSTNVTSRFKGTIERVVNNVPDTDTAEKHNGVWSYNKGHAAGNNVVIRVDPGQDPNHPNGFYVTNMHLKANSIPSNIAVGNKVNIGDKIGVMGRTGWSTGEHLHYQFSEDYTNKSTTWDPTSSVTGGNYNTGNSVTNPGTQSYYTPTSSSSTTFLSTPTSSENGEKMSFGSYISTIIGHAKDFLSKLTGGIISNDGSSSSSSSYGSSTYAVPEGNTSKSYTKSTSPEQRLAEYKIDSSVIKKLLSELDTTKKIELLSNSDVNKITNIEKYIIKPARIIDLYTGEGYDISWGGPPGTTNTKYSTLTPNDTLIKRRIIGIADWPSTRPRPCVLILGDRQIAIGTSDYPVGRIVGNANPGNACPDSTEPEDKRDKYGNIIIGGHFKMYYKDSLDTNGSKTKDSEAHCNAALLAFKIVLALFGPEGPNAELADTGTRQDIWNALKARGYSDVAAAGIMGCWEAESGNNPASVEGNYLPDYPGTELLMTSKDAMDDWVVNRLFPMYAKNGMKINKSFYGPYDDGHYYPGIGLAGWTGNRTQELTKFADDKGKSWAGLRTQLEFFDKEMQEPYFSSKLSDINNYSTPEEAGRKFFTSYESGGSTTGVEKRQNWARSMYNNFATSGSSDMDSDKGGEFNDSMISSNNNQYINSGRKSKSNNRSSYSSNSNINNSTQFKNMSQNINEILSSATTNNSDNLEQMALIMMQILTELKQINGNTSSSTSLLGALNEKEFVDQGLRNSISALGKASSLNRRKGSKQNTFNYNNTKTIASLVRP